MQIIRVPVHKIPHHCTFCVAELVNLSFLERKKGDSFVALVLMTQVQIGQRLSS
jgi:hypothetical protein